MRRQPQPPATLRKSGSAVLAFAWVTTGASLARAGNTDSFYFSDDAALTAGAVTATASDAGAIWYNPAGLGANARDQAKLSGTGFALRIRNVPNALSTAYPGSQATSTVGLGSSDFFATPNATAFVRNLNDRLSWGFGIFVTQLDTQSASAETDFGGVTNLTPTPSKAQYQQRIDDQESTALYHAGPAIGWQALPSVRVGASLFATYGKDSFFFQYLQDVQSADTSATYDTLLEQRGSDTYLGAQAQVGLQWDPTEDWHVGLVLRSPEYVITSSQNEADVTSQATVSPASTPMAAFELDLYKNAPVPAFTVINPARVIVSVATNLTRNTLVSAEVDYQSGVDNDSQELVPVVNGRVGVRWQAKPNLALGVGLFTDRSNLPESQTAFGDRVHYYGITSGVTFSTPLALAQHPGPSTLVFTSTFACRYAIGLGQAVTETIDADSGTLTLGTTSVVYQEIVPYIGAGMLF